MPPEKKAVISRLTDDLADLILDEDLDEAKLNEASEGLLPQLLDALHDAGFGTLRDEE